MAEETFVTPEQEAATIRDFEKMGTAQVRDALQKGTMSLPLHNLAYRWLSDRERESERRSEASQAEQIEIARSARDAAWAARTAKTANKIAIAAAIAAVVAATASIISIFLPHVH